LLQFARATFDVSEVIEEHFHSDMVEIFYVIAEKVKIIYKDSVDIAAKGDSLIIYPDQSHSFKFIEKTELIYFNLAKSNI